MSPGSRRSAGASSNEYVLITSVQSRHVSVTATDESPLHESPATDQALCSVKSTVYGPAGS